MCVVDMVDSLRKRKEILKKMKDITAKGTKRKGKKSEKRKECGLGASVRGKGQREHVNACL